MKRPLLPAILLGLPLASFAQADRAWPGLCDASAAVPAGPALMVVANDEDNVLRVFDSLRDSPALASHDLERMYPGAFPKGESDIEAAAAAPDRVYWITSHGANKAGKARPDRHRLFATRISETNGVVTVKPSGMPWPGLLAALASHPPLRDIDWVKAANTAPKQAGGLNIEALCFTPDGKLWIGFRSPVPAGRALLVPLLNPAEVLDQPGAVARLGEPVRLNLGGHGLRDMAMHPDGKSLLLLAGPVEGKGPFAIHRWSGRPADAPVLWPDAPLAGLHPEGLLVSGGRLLVISDDGGERIGDRDCKDCPPEHRRFRGRWVALPAAAP